jgi:hypothetical protein
MLALQSGARSVRHHALHRSSRTTPCPACGRTKDADCRWSDDWIACHSGGAGHSLKLGETITLNGQRWFLAATDAGHSGRSHIYRPDRLLPGRHCPRQQRREDVLHAVTVRRRIECLRPRVHAALRLRAWDLCTPAELRFVHETLASAEEAMRHLQRAKRTDPNLARLSNGLCRWIKQLGYQAADLQQFERSQLGMQEGWR